MDMDNTSSLLVFGGPYSNLPATRAMHAKAEAEGIASHNIICTGDVVAYGAEPEQTAALIRAWGVHTIAGNCEEQLAGDADDCGCGFEEGSVCDVLSRGWYPYARAGVSDETKSWMARLPTSLTFHYGGRKFHVIHGGGRQTNRFIFESDERILHEEAAAIDADVILAGHAGIPFIKTVGHKVWVNAGVVGVPANDGTPHGWYAVIQHRDGEIRISLRRLAYDHVAAAASMRRAGHANGYARALVTGIWPSHDVLPPLELEQTGIKLRQKTVRLRKQLATA